MPVTTPLDLYCAILMAICLGIAAGTFLSTWQQRIKEAREWTR